MKWSKIKNSNEIPIELSNENLCVVVHKGGWMEKEDGFAFRGDSQAKGKGCRDPIQKEMDTFILNFFFILNLFMSPEIPWKSIKNDVQCKLTFKFA